MSLCWLHQRHECGTIGNKCQLARRAGMRLWPAAGVCGTSVDQCKHVQGRKERSGPAVQAAAAAAAPAKPCTSGRQEEPGAGASCEQALFPWPRCRRRCRRVLPVPLACAACRFHRAHFHLILCSANGAAGRALQHQLLLVCAKPGRTAGPGPLRRHQAPNDRVAAAAAVRGRWALCG